MNAAHPTRRAARVRASYLVAGLALALIALVAPELLAWAPRLDKAVLINWHLALCGVDNRMRPGIDPEQADG